MANAPVFYVRLYTFPRLSQKSYRKPSPSAKGVSCAALCCFLTLLDGVVARLAQPLAVVRVILPLGRFSDRLDMVRDCCRYQLALPLAIDTQGVSLQDNFSPSSVPCPIPPCGCVGAGLVVNIFARLVAFGGGA